MIFYDWMDNGAHVVSEALGVDFVTIRLLLSVFLGYPIAAIFCLLAPRWSIPQRQLFLLVSGVFLFCWNFGSDIIHLFIGILATMLVNYFFLRSKISVIFAFVFNMAYLLSGSYIYNRGTYDINWTTPYCILCLRLIGLTWDLYDATKPLDKMSASQKKAALYGFPGILETVSFCFVPTAFITGPQFSMRHYRSFLDGSLRPYTILRNRPFMERFVYNTKVQRTVIRFSMGMVAIVVLSKVLPIFPADYMLTDKFQQEHNFFYRFGYVVIFAQITLFRYVAVWLIGEGSCVLLGLGCTGLVYVHELDETSRKTRKPTSSTSESNPNDPCLIRTQSALSRKDHAVPWTDVVDASGEYLYDSTKVLIREADHTACASISLVNLLLATNTDHLVAGFNINTNKWVLDYVYKRLRFLGDKRLSQFFTLLFLAVWHGSYSGYYVNFALEFITIAAESDFLRIVKQSKHADFLYKTKTGFLVTSILGKLHVLFLLATPLTAFYLLHFSLWFHVLKSTYFIGFVYLLWPIFKPFVKNLFPCKPRIDQIQPSQSNGSISEDSNRKDL